MTTSDLYSVGQFRGHKAITFASRAGKFIAIMLALSLGQNSSALASMHFAPPEIGKGLNCTNWRSCAGAGQEFTKILRQKFPAGTNESRLRLELLAQDFQPLPSSIKSCQKRGQSAQIGARIIDCPSWDQNWNPRNYLSFGWGILPCGSSLSVLWSSDRRGKIVHLEGHYNYSCI